MYTSHIYTTAANSVHFPEIFHEIVVIDLLITCSTCTYLSYTIQYTTGIYNRWPWAAPRKSARKFVVLIKLVIGMYILYILFSYAV